MRYFLTLVLLALGGCASYSTGMPIPDNSSIPVAVGRSAVIGGGRLDAYLSPTSIEAPIDTVWRALLATYADLEMPVESVNQDAYTVGSPRITARGRFLGRPISTFLTCGGTAGVAEVADAHAVTMSVFAVLARAAAGGTELRIRVGGTAKDPFTSTPPRPCSTTGALEVRIDERLRTRLGMAPATLPARDAPSAALPTPQEVAEASPVRPAPEVTLPGAAAVRPSHALLLALGGVAGGAAGTYLGSLLGADCETHCWNARGTLGPLVANSVLVPTGVHLSNRGRGELLQSFMASAGWGALGAVVAGLSGEEWGVLAVIPGQLLSSILIERATTGGK